MIDHNLSQKTDMATGLIIGFLFGFLLQKGGVTQYDVIMGQLLLTDFTVIKIMLSSVIVTMLGISILYPKKMVTLHIKKGSMKNAVIGGLLFGIGFGTLGYCPGTIAGAIGQGSLDALFAGVPGIIIGSFAFASIYKSATRQGLLREDRYSGYSLFDQVKGNPFKLTGPISGGIIVLLLVIEFVIKR